MAQERYLRQLGSGTIYHWTPTLAVRKDMVPLTLNSANKRLAAIKKELALRKKGSDPKQKAAKAQELKHMRGVVGELTEAEAELEEVREEEIKEIKEEAAEETHETEITEESAREKRIAEDDQIKKINKMTKEELTGYILREFGFEVEPERKVKDLKDQAIELRRERILEAEGIG